MKWLLSLFGGSAWSYLISALLSVGASSYVTYTFVHNANAVTIADLKTQAAQQKAANVTAALDQLQGFISQIHLADANFQNTLDAIDGKFSTLKGALDNVAKQKPLPVDCVIDSERLRILTAATAAANAKTPAASP